MDRRTIRRESTRTGTWRPLTAAVILAALFLFLAGGCCHRAEPTCPAAPGIGSSRTSSTVGSRSGLHGEARSGVSSKATGIRSLARSGNTASGRAGVGNGPGSGSTKGFWTGFSLDRGMRLALFNHLVAVIERLHVFSTQTDHNLGFTWKQGLPDLRRAFEQADSLPKLVAALWYLGNSLHNPHCYYMPPKPLSGKSGHRGGVQGAGGRSSADAIHLRRLNPGFVLGVEWIQAKTQRRRQRSSAGRTLAPSSPRGHARYFVRTILDHSLDATLAVGASLLSYDGIPATRLARTFHLWSNENNWFSISRAVASRLSFRYVVGPTPAPSTWRFSDPRRGKTITVTRPWRRPPKQRGPAWAESGIPYGKRCSRLLPRRNYGSSYRLVTRGIGYCLYASKARRYRPYPIVRQYTFLYSNLTRHARRTTMADLVQADYFALKGQLAALARTNRLKGVLLDLRDNHGGNNPNWFLDWWASASYKDHFIYVRLDDELAQAWHKDLAKTSNVTRRAQIQRYLAAMAHRKSGEQFMGPMPFFCVEPDCSGPNLYRPTHRVTRAPVALLTGPGCHSSCDEIAQVFSDYDFGPLVGEPTSAGYTTVRIPVPITLPMAGSVGPASHPAARSARSFGPVSHPAARSARSVGPASHPAARPSRLAGRFSGSQRPSRPLNLGTLHIALSYEVSGRTGKPVEAVPLHLTRWVPKTFANRKCYSRLLVDAAITALKARHHGGGHTARR
ncbi:MAG: hypothetical protein J7M25_10965 [Deltaproteobacteria bacterium]|nr:hypothetical protein [Deltaproteobacteria bacterium]